jgi:hypothetical protein
VIRDQFSWLCKAALLVLQRNVGSKRRPRRGWDAVEFSWLKTVLLIWNRGIIFEWFNQYG